MYIFLYQVKVTSLSDVIINEMCFKNRGKLALDGRCVIIFSFVTLWDSIGVGYCTTDAVPRQFNYLKRSSGKLEKENTGRKSQIPGQSISDMFNQPIAGRFFRVRGASFVGCQTLLSQIFFLFTINSLEGSRKLPTSGPISNMARMHLTRTITCLHFICRTEQ